MNIIFKKASEKNIPLAHALLSACGKHMHENLNLNHWHPFMSLKDFHLQISNKDLYLAYYDKELIATFNLSKEPRDYYSSTIWVNSSEPAAYLGQLGIAPLWQGKGIGRLCMAEIERITKEMGCCSLRLDALNSHPWLKLFYLRLGYTACGTVKPNNWDLLCFEKVIC